MDKKDVIEIDSFAELIKIDKHYEMYMEKTLL